MTTGRRRYQLLAVAFTVCVALFAVPMMHATSTISGAVTTPGGLNDAFCLSCHGNTRGHIVPPDRSCLSCHATDFDRHEQSADTEVHLDRVSGGQLALLGTYLAFCLSLLLFLLKPLSAPRVVLLVTSLLGLAGVAAVVLGVVL